MEIFVKKHVSNTNFSKIVVNVSYIKYSKPFTEYAG